MGRVRNMSELTDTQAAAFGHSVYALMNGREWDSDTFDAIAVFASAVGRDFDEPNEED